MFIGFNDSDRIVALDTETGKEKWTFYSDGPVRFPPVVCNGKIYITRDRNGYETFGNFGGFKSGCSINLVAADDVLNAPDYTRTCICSYQNQTSLALVHMPDVEIWSFDTITWDGAPIKQVGINFGAP